MAITVTVELPENVDQFDLLEVSSLISVPTGAPFDSWRAGNP